MGVVSWAVWVRGVRRPDGHIMGEVGLCLGLLLRLALIKRILQSHVGQDDAPCHATLGRGASEALKVLVHTILSEGSLNGSSCSATYKGATVLPLQHLNLARGQRQTIKKKLRYAPSFLRDAVPRCFNTFLSWRSVDSS